MSRTNTIHRFITSLAEYPATDAELHARFVTERSESAFAELVRRHGPMVRSVCRNCLSNDADADDAFQATFLAFVRSAKSIRKPETLGAWLHGVAVRVCLKLKTAAARRQHQERKVAVGESTQPVVDSQWETMLAAVHEEVERLPDVERTAFVMCILEGIRQPDAAERLGWKPGTLTGRLSKAKKRLLDRLTHRGLTPSAALGVVGLGASATSAVVPSALANSVRGFVTDADAIPMTILQLSQGAIGMTLTKTKLLAATVLLAGGLLTGFGPALFTQAVAQTSPKAAQAPRPAKLAADNPNAPLRLVDAPPPDLAERGSYIFVPSTTRPPTPEYQFVDVSKYGTDELKKFISAELVKGWELVAIDRPAPGSSNKLYPMVIFKRTKALVEMQLDVEGVPAAYARERYRDPADASSKLKSQNDTPPPARAPSRSPDESLPKLDRLDNVPSPARASNIEPEPYFPSEHIPNPAVTPARPTQNLPRTVESTKPATVRETILVEPALPVKPVPADAPILPRTVKASPKLTLHTISVEEGRSESVAKVLKELIAIDEFEGEVTAAIADSTSNSVVLKASEQGYKRVKNLLVDLESRAIEASERKRSIEAKLAEQKRQDEAAKAKLAEEKRREELKKKP